MTHRRLSSVILVLPIAFLLCGASSFAQENVILPELAYKRLMNDLQVVVASEPALGEDMTLGLVLRSGSTFDMAGKGGTAYLLSQMFLKATEDKNAKDIQDELTSLGVTIDIQCDWDAFRFILHGQNSKFERALLILYQAVCEAKFDDVDFAAVKQSALDQLRRPEDPRRSIRTQFEARLFRGTTYGRPQSGTQQSVQNITIGDLRLFYKKHFSPNAASLVVVSNVQVPLLLQKITRIWGVWVRKDEVPFSFLAPRGPSSRNIFLDDDPASPASQFAIGNLWPARDEPAYYAASLAAKILQEKLTKELPTSLLTVNASSRRMTGPFYIQGQAAADQTLGDLNKILALVEALQKSTVSKEDLARVQQQWIEDFGRQLHTSDGVCGALLDSELYRLGTNYMVNFPDIIRRIDADAIREAVKNWIFPGGVVIIVHGPAALLQPALQPLGSPQALAP